MRAVVRGGIAALLWLAPAPAAAQDACAEHMKWPAVGQWAEYKGTYEQKDPVTTRYAVVGSEQRDGREYKWIELKLRDEKKQQDIIYQMLVTGNPVETGDVQEVVMKSGSDPAMKLGGMMMKMMRGQLAKNSAFHDICKEATLVGTEKVSVPAGSFTAKHYQSEKYETDTWVDPSAGFPMVKTVGKSHQMELVATGSGAKSSITETPRELGKQ